MYCVLDCAPPQIYLCSHSIRGNQSLLHYISIHNKNAFYLLTKSRRTLLKRFLKRDTDAFATIAERRPLGGTQKSYWTYFVTNLTIQTATPFK